MKSRSVISDSVQCDNRGPVLWLDIASSTVQGFAAGAEVKCCPRPFTYEHPQHPRIFQAPSTVLDDAKQYLSSRHQWHKSPQKMHSETWQKWIKRDNTDGRLSLLSAVEGDRRSSSSMDGCLIYVDLEVRLFRSIQTMDLLIVNVVHDILLEILRIYLHIVPNRNIVSLPRNYKPATAINSFENFSCLCGWSSETTSVLLAGRELYVLFWSHPCRWGFHIG